MSSASEDLQNIEKGSSLAPYPEKSDALSDPSDPFEVTLEQQDNPKALPTWRRWLAALIINAGAICVTGASSMAATAELGVARDFHVSNEVATLAVTLFVVGLGTGPMLVGPLAAVLGQRIIYISSFVLLFAFTWPVAFSHSLAVHLVFRFLGGLSGSAFLSIGGATISDLFNDEEVGTPMAAYTISTFIGPVITPVWCGFVFQTLLLILGIPETNIDVILKSKAKRLRKETSGSRYYAPAEKEDTNLPRAIAARCWHIFELILYDRMALLLDIWLSLILGILYLVFQVFPIIFGELHHFSPEQIGLTFLGVFVGLCIALCSQTLWNRYRRHIACKYKNNPPPEVWLAMGKVGGILIPISLYCLAFTTYARIHWIAPIISSIPFGIGICFVYTSTFTYLVTAFRPMAAEALTGNAIMRTTFAAGFPLFSTAMYHTLGTVGATALLAGLMTVMAPLPFIFDHIGERMRNKSPFAHRCSQTV